MKYIKKFNELHINIPGIFNDKSLMFKEFEEVFGFPIHSLTDRLLEWEDRGFNFVLCPVVWINIESNSKYNLPESAIYKFPDKSTNISSYVNQLCRYRTEAEGLDDNIEVVEFVPIDPKDIVAACIVIHEMFPSEIYLDKNINTKEMENKFNDEFQDLIKSIERRFDLVEIPGSDSELKGANSIGTIFKRSRD